MRHVLPVSLWLVAVAAVIIWGTKLQADAQHRGEKVTQAGGTVTWEEAPGDFAALDRRGVPLPAEQWVLDSPDRLLIASRWQQGLAADPSYRAEEARWVQHYFVKTQSETEARQLAYRHTAYDALNHADALIAAAEE